MTSAPSDLSKFRTAVVIPKTGLTGNAVGVAPDKDHLKGGGYHVGCEDIQAISRWNLDYSTRQPRDRLDGTNDSSAMDIGDDWPRGGRAAWLRFNNLLVSCLRNADPALAALRATNFSPDGTLRKRYDTNNRSQGVIDSTDSVYMHTHLEWWRNTVGTATRARSLTRLGQIIDAAIANKPLAAIEGDTMPVELTNSVAIPSADAVPADWQVQNPPNESQQVGVILGYLYRRDYLTVQGLIKTYDAVKALQSTPPVAVVQLSQAQLDQLRNDITALVSSTLAAKIGTAVEFALAGEAGQAAIVAAVNVAEDS